MTLPVCGYHLSMKLICAAAICVALSAQERVPGSAPLTFEGDPAVAMVSGIHAYLDRELQRPAAATATRERLAKIIGAVDRRVPVTALEMVAAVGQREEIAIGAGYRIYAVRWPVFEDMSAEGLLLEPDGTVNARIVAVPDADETPEKLAEGAARRLAENGCQVLIPVLIDRADTWSGIPGIKMTNLPHREWIYRMSYETGRHIIGYEVEKILAAVDWFAHENAARQRPIGVAGYGEGGMLALYAAALDERIGATLVSGYFAPRREIWKEPVYRDVWGLLPEFGDAEVARLIAPRGLVIEASHFPEVGGPPASSAQRRGAAPGALTAPPLSAVKSEVERARPWLPGIQLAGAGNAPAEASLIALLRALGVKTWTIVTDAIPREVPARPDPAVRMHRQFDEMVSHTQAVIRAAEAKRVAFWAKADASSPEKWKQSTQAMREYIWNEVIGRMPDPGAPANPRSRLIYDEPKFRGYEVMLDVWPGIFAYGILLVPKDIREGERRPVVVCQHGLEGRPQDVADPKSDSPAYHRYAVRLAEEGFVTFAPLNPYIGQDRFRQIQRKGHPLKLSLFSFIIGQHQRILEWLGGLPFVDRARIGFYGLSYGGKTAVRVPPLLDGYALSICSADFNEWVWKNTNVDTPYSYLLTQEYDMIEFDLAEVANYSDLANLMAPRPFMVERGHDDNVSADEWVAHEYAKVRRFYDKMGIGDRTEIEFFNGPHSIHGVGTFAFLRKHLRWPN